MDLIEPFPLSEIERVWGWNMSRSSLTRSDDGPQNREEFVAWAKVMFPFWRTFAIIDKLNQIYQKHEAPLLGVIGFEPAGPRNGYLHVATSYKAWGSGFVDEAGKAVLAELFRSQPSLLRVSAWLFDCNFPAKALARRVGFKHEGVLRDFVSQDGNPKDISHFGYTRRMFECLSQQPSQLSHPSEAASSAPSEAEESKEA